MAHILVRILRRSARWCWYASVDMDVGTAPHTMRCPIRPPPRLETRAERPQAQYPMTHPRILAVRASVFAYCMYVRMYVHWTERRGPR